MDREECVERVRRICLGLGDSSEKLSHGEPTFFTKKRVFTMCSLNHHNDGEYAVFLPTEPGMQAAYLEAAPKKFYYPPYVGIKGWIGVRLNQVDDEELGDLVTQAWKIIRKPATKKRAGI